MVDTCVLSERATVIVYTLSGGEEEATIAVKRAKAAALYLSSSN